MELSAIVANMGLNALCASSYSFGGIFKKALGLPDVLCNFGRAKTATKLLAFRNFMIKYNQKQASINRQAFQTSLKMADKRSYRRFSYENNIYLKLDNNPAQVIQGKLLDISFTGVSIFLKESVNPDAWVQTIVQFDVATSVERHFIGKGRVVQVRPHKLYAENGYRIGVEFVEVDKEVVLDILNRLESKILDEIRRRNQTPRRNPGMF